MIFLQTMILNSLVNDSTAWSNEFNGVKIEEGVFVHTIYSGNSNDSILLKVGDKIISINGVEITDYKQGQNLLNQNPDNAILQYEVERDGEILFIPVKVTKYFNIQSFAFSLMGFLFLFVGTIVAYSKPRITLNFMFFVLGCTACLTFILIGNINAIFELSSFYILNSVIAQIIFFPLFVHFFLTFPVNLQSRYRRTVVILIYTLFFTIVALQILIPTEKAVHIAVLVYALLCLVSGFVLFLFSYYKIKFQEQKKPLKIILWGFIIGGIGFVYINVVSISFKLPFFLINPVYYIPAIIMSAIPISFGYAIFRYKILDSEFIVKRSLVFGLVTFSVVSIYLLIVFFVDNLFTSYFQENRILITVLIIVFIAFTFDSVNSRIKDLVNTHLYRERYNYRKSLLQFTKELPYMNNMNEIIIKLGNSVSDAMGINSLYLWLNSKSVGKLINQNYEDSKDKLLIEESIQEIDDIFLSIYKNSQQPVLLYNINLSELPITEKGKQFFKDEGIVLSVPIILKGEVVGSLNFGDKPSGKVYSDEDIDLLKTISSQCSIAFENVRMQTEEIQKQKLEREIQIAAKIQNELLPKGFNDFEELSIDAINLPAESIAGDFYDIKRLDKDRILVLVADVSGKGIPAALYISRIQAMVHFASRIFTDPKDILCEVNRLLHKKTPDNFFMTILLGIFDMKQMTLSICRAGHPQLLYYQGKELVQLCDKSIGIGIVSPEKFNCSVISHKLSLNPGDLFFFYTDGLTGQFNDREEFLDLNKIRNVIETNLNKYPSDINGEIISLVVGFRDGTEQKDDITMLTIKVK